MSLLTNWGYTLTAADELPDVITLDEFNTYTGGRYAAESDRITAEISAASAGIRAFCGWHLYPSMACELKTILSKLRISHVGNDLVIQLPARYVTAVESVTIGGQEYTDFYADPNGDLTVFHAYCGLSQNAVVDIVYTAGLPDALMAPIKELAAYRVTHAVAVPAGITSEASGGVSVTYNANWINNARATGLASDNKELLAPYRLQGVF